MVDFMLSLLKSMHLDAQIDDPYVGDASGTVFMHFKTKVPIESEFFQSLCHHMIWTHILRDFVSLIKIHNNSMDRFSKKKTLVL